VRSAAFAVTRRLLEGLERFEADSPTEQKPSSHRPLFASLGQRAAGGG
jgi:hypothetical protein